MANFLAPIINGQQFDANGDPLSSGEIYVYLAGTSTPATTYTTQAGGTPNTFPIDLNTLGVNEDGEIWLIGGSSYKFVIKDAAGVTLRTLDNMSGINDSSVTADQWLVYQAPPTYVSATSFTVAGDQTQIFQVGRRIKTTNTGGTVYSTIIRSAFSTSTTVTVINDSGTLDSGLSAVSTGLITAQNASLPGTLNLPPFRNRIINGAFRIDQRNSGAAQTLVAAAAIAYTVDRFYASCTGANSTIQQIAGTGYKYAVRITGAASVSATLYGQRIESSNCYDWANRQVNVQIPISASNLATVTWNAYTADATDNFAAKTLLATGSLSLSTTVETKYFSFNAGSGAVRGIAIEFVTGAIGAGQTITYQGAMQAEAGQVSSFEAVEFGADFARCERYYEVGTVREDGYGQGGQVMISHCRFRTAKRSGSPTISFQNTISVGLSANSVGLYGDGVTQALTLSGAVFLTFSGANNWQATAEL